MLLGGFSLSYCRCEKSLGRQDRACGRVADGVGGCEVVMLISASIPTNSRLSPPHPLSLATFSKKKTCFGMNNIPIHITLALI